MNAAKWIANRWAEPSTRIGLGILGAAILGAVDHPPQTQADWIKWGVLTAAGVAGIATKAPGAPDKPITVFSA